MISNEASALRVPLSNLNGAIAAPRLLSEETAPLVHGMSGLGLAGLLLGVWLGAGVLKAIKKSGGLYEDRF